MALQIKTSKIPWYLILIFLLLSTGIGTAGYLYYKNQREHIIKESKNEISAIADLKVRQIVNWKNERMSDAMVILNNPFIIKSVQQFLKNPSTSGLKQELLIWMANRQKYYHYRSVFLLDEKGSVRLSVTNENEQVGPHAQTLVKEAIRTKGVVFSDIHQGETAGDIHLDLFIPLLVSNGQDTLPIGILLVRLDPNQFLYPIIQSWPTPSLTAESLFVRPEGNEVLFLNELRHRKDTALTFRLPISEKRLPSAMAVRGEEGVFEGIDYRGVPVFAALRAIPDSPWFLIAKVDVEEIYAPVRTYTWLLTFLVFVLIAGAGVSVGLLWRHQRALFYRKQYESELERQTLLRRYEYLTKYANDIILMMDQDLKIVEANERALESYGYTRDELFQLSLNDLRSPETQYVLDENMKKVQELNGLLFETVHQRKDGTTFPVENSSRVIEVGDKMFYQSIIRDISERKRAEEALALHAVRIQALLDLHMMANESQDQIMNVVLEAALKVTQSRFSFIGLMDKTESFMTIHAWSKDTMEQCSVSDKPIHFPISEAGVWGDCVRQRKPIIINDYEAPWPTKKGYPEGHVPIRRFLSIPVFDGGRIVAVAAVANKGKDYTEDDSNALITLTNKMWEIIRHKQAKEALRESEEKYRSLFEDSKDVVYISTLEGRFVDINPAGVELFGYSSKEELLQVDIAKDIYVYSGDRKKFIRTLEQQGFVKDYKLLARRKDGEIMNLLLTATPVRDEKRIIVAYRGIMRDVTHQRKLEQQLLQSQKMEAVGQLAGGVAHDFNNILTAIIGYASLLKMKMREDDPLRRNADQILASSERAASLTHSLLAFSRKQIINLQPMNLNEIVKRVEKLLLRLIGEDIELKTILTDEDLTIMADSNQIEQVLMNLATNARDAMPDGGSLTVETEIVELDKEYIKTHGYGEPGMYALILITDTGEGMDEKTRERIFEPFFTTKEVGKGTGLGLSMVYGIIKQHNGYINAYSELGKGTTFKIYLPLTKAEVVEIKPTEPIPPIGGTETILLAEDDTDVRTFTKSVLEEFGYKVIEAEDGEDAINKFMENKDKIHLLMLDVIMPKKNGREVYEEIKKTLPDIKALFMSGYSANVIHEKGILEEGLNFVLKPISPTVLLRKIREALEK